MLRQLVNQGLGHVLEHIKAPRHIAVEGGIAHRQLAFVASGQHQGAGLVGNGHQQHAPAAGLNILLADISGQAGKFVLQGGHEGLVDSVNGDGLVTHSQILGLAGSILLAHRRGVLKGHHHRPDPRRPQRIHCQHQAESGVDAAGQAQHHSLKPVLVHIVAQPDYQSFIGGGQVLHRGRHIPLNQPALSRFVIQIHREEALTEGRTSHPQLAVGTDRHAAPVKDQFILSARHVDVDHWHAAPCGPAGQQFLALLLFAAMKGRGVDVDQSHRVGQAGLADVLFRPEVFTDAQGHGDAPQRDHLRSLAGNEIALLIEDLVVGQLLLGVFSDASAAMEHPGHVLQALRLPPGIAHHHIVVPN